MQCDVAGYLFAEFNFDLSTAVKCFGVNVLITVVDASTGNFGCLGIRNTDDIRERLDAIRPNDGQCEGTWVEGTRDSHPIANDYSRSCAYCNVLWWVVKGKCDGIIHSKFRVACWVRTNECGRGSDGIVEGLCAIHPGDSQCECPWVEGTHDFHSFVSDCSDACAHSNVLWWIIKSKSDGIVDSKFRVDCWIRANERCGGSDGIIERLGAVCPSNRQCKGTRIKGTCDFHSFVSDCSDTCAYCNVLWWVVKGKGDSIVHNQRRADGWVRANERCRWADSFAQVTRDECQIEDIDGAVPVDIRVKGLICGGCRAKVRGNQGQIEDVYHSIGIDIRCSQAVKVCPLCIAYG